MYSGSFWGYLCGLSLSHKNMRSIDVNGDELCAAETGRLSGKGCRVCFTSLLKLFPGVTWLFWATCDLTWSLAAAQWHSCSFQCQKRNRIILDSFITAGSACRSVTQPSPDTSWSLTVLLLKGKKTIHNTQSESFIYSLLIPTWTYKNTEWPVESMCLCKAGMCCASE